MPSGSAIGFRGSSSTSSPKMVTGWHVLKVEGYSRTKGLSGNGIKSSTFTVGGHRWYIRYFPGGFSSRSSDWVGVDLNLQHPADRGNVLTRFKFSIVDQAGEKVYPPYNLIDESILEIISSLSSKTVSQGKACFIARRELESSYLKDDSFKIRCDVTVIKEIHAVDTTVELVTVPPPDLHCHLGDLLSSQVGGDIVFEVDGQLFTAHRYVLAARSSVFMAELFGPLKEKTASHVRIDDMKAMVFKAMLHFIYTDFLPDIEKDEKTVMSQHLLVAADRYNLERLKLICEDILRKQINTDIVATTLVLAEQQGCCGLKNACFKFLMSPGNLKTVMESDSYQYLKNSCPSLLDEMIAKIAP
ncbi:unnamed protein product [Urochloa decumbens]|uniref:Uncharacterized protein n=1 Tax=Urochloa decumbens TaxID=240449 RepID=A0ABC9B4H5_9POAL